jgi:hypothetical protein
MGRKSKLTEKQWEEIGRRLLAGEKGRALAKEFGIAESTIRERFSAQHAEIKSVAHQVVAAESALKALPISAQIAVFNLADHLRSISGHLASAGNYGAATAHRLTAIAHANVQKIDDAKPLDADSIEALRGVAALTKLANEASTIGLNLLSANKEAVRDAQDDEPKPVRVVVQVEDASRPEPEAQQATG